MIKKSSDKILSGLNSAQKKAVMHGAGPLLVVAGAGTGKTRVITYRIARLISGKSAKPSEILALTFTEKAASEMAARVDLLVPYGFNDVRVSTFHALGDFILRDNAVLLGLSPDFKVMSKPETIVFFREHLFEFPLKLMRPLGNPAWNVSSILNVISRAKDEDVSPEEYEKFAAEQSSAASTKEEQEEAQRQAEIAAAFRKYEELKIKKNLIDFGDQVVLTLKLFRENPSALSKYRSQFKYILVDEFQDTNYTQFELLKLLASPHNNITVVGDDDQSIFKFRGACLSNILGFKEYYKGSAEIVLTENYRSTRNILDSSYRLIVHNNPERLEVKHKIKKKLNAFRGVSGARVSFKSYDTVFTESEETARIITGKIKSKKRKKYSDFAVLVRTNGLASYYIRSFNSAGIPWKFSGSRGLTERPEIKYLAAFLKCAANPDDSVSFFSLLEPAMPFKGAFAAEVSQEDLVKINSIASRNNRSVYYVIERPDKFRGTDEISAAGMEALKKAAEKLAGYVKDSGAMNTGQLLYKFLKDGNILKKLAAAKTPEEIEEAHNVAKFFEIITSFGEISSDDKVKAFVDYITPLFEGISESGGDEQLLPESELDYDAVNILTIHKAKGLEFPVVFMAGLVEGQFPSVSRKSPIELPDGLVKEMLPGGDYHIQEERRLFYVGLTRAKDELYLSSAVYYGGKKPKKISRFVQEALDKPLVDIKTIKPSVREELERFAPGAAKPGLQIGISALTAPVNLTPYAIDDYLTCPLKYKYVHILRIPLPKHHTLQFGDIIHRVLKEYNIALMEGKKFGTEQILELYGRLWSPEGFLSREHEEKRFESGRKMLVDIITTMSKGNPHLAPAPVGVEEEFKFIVDENIVVRGRWDRLDEVDGSRVIIDFKTSGGITDEEDALKETKKSRQLVIYALGHKEKYGKLPEYAALYFLEPGIISKIEVSEKKIEKLFEEIREAASGIRSGHYPAKPGYFSCEFCPYRTICARSI